LQFPEIKKLQRSDIYSIIKKHVAPLELFVFAQLDFYRYIAPLGLFNMLVKSFLDKLWRSEMFIAKNILLTQNDRIIDTTSFFIQSNNLRTLVPQHLRTFILEP